MSSKVSDHPYRDFEHAGWERAAEAYADTFEAATRLFAPALLEAVGAGAKVELLDVACGTGFVTEAAAARGATALGVDFSHSMIAESAKRHPTLAFQEADAEALPFSDGQFDAVVINFGVHHFPFPVRALAEAYRVLRAGGRLGFTVWASPEEHALHRIALEAVRGSGDVGATLPAPPNGSINEIATCVRLLQESGFGVVPPRAEKLHAALSLDSVADLVHMLQNGTVRLSTLIRSQPHDRVAAILALIEKAAARYIVSGQLEIPVVAILAIGIKTRAAE